MPKVNPLLPLRLIVLHKNLPILDPNAVEESRELLRQVKRVVEKARAVVAADNLVGGNLLAELRATLNGEDGPY